MAILAFLYCEEFVKNPHGPWCQWRIQRPGKGGGEKYEIYAAAFGGHLFYDLFSQG